MYLIGAAPDSNKTEVKDPKVQTEAVEIGDQYVQAGTTVVEQGMLTHCVFC